MCYFIIYNRKFYYYTGNNKYLQKYNNKNITLSLIYNNKYITANEAFKNQWEGVNRNYQKIGGLHVKFI